MTEQDHRQPLSPERARRLLAALSEEPPPAAWPAPARIGPYELQCLSASGGMGIVYKAQQAHPRRTVAVKVLKPEHATRALRRRFDREIDVLGSLQHPSIAQIHDAGILRIDALEVPYFVMEWVRGAKPITSFAADRQLSVAERLELVARVCDAVSYGHQRGIIHRDLKPENILVDEAGTPKVIDFGVALITNADIAATTILSDARELVGTLQYMSPEQCDGDPLDIDARTDVYSLGVVLYELLCGVPPHDIAGCSISGAVQAIRDQEPRRPGERRADLRGNIEAIVLKSLSKDREDRYQTVGELATDLRRHLAGQVIAARPPGAWVRSRQWVHSHPVLTTTTVCAVIGAILTPLIVLGVARAALKRINDRPAYVQLAHERRSARLVARDGHVIEEWHTNIASGIQLALLASSTAAGEPDLVLIGYAASLADERSGRLDLYGVQDGSCALIRSDTVRGLPPGIRGPDHAVGMFNPHRATVADLLPERAGPEFAVLFSHAVRSPRVIRIYDSRLELVSEFCHDGSLMDPYWIESERLLVFAGTNQGLKQTSLPLGRSVDPMVVFAVRPLAGVHLGWLSDALGNECVAWYRQMEPLESGEIFSMLALHAPEPGDGVDGARLQLAVLESGAGLSWFIGGDGRLRAASLTLERPAAGDYPPDLGRFHLVDIGPQ